MSKHAFVVAISEYSNSDNNLPGAKEDVPTIMPVLSSYGFNDIEVIQDKQATRENIIQGLNNLFKDRQPGDVCVFYFSGHGVMFIQKNDSENQDSNGQYEALVPYEGTESSLILDNWLGEFFSNSIPDGVVFWGLYDSCYSGDLYKDVILQKDEDEQDQIYEQDKTLKKKDIVKDLMPQFPQEKSSKQTKKLIVDDILKNAFHFGAADEDERAICKPINGKSRSVFTWAIAEVLAGAPELTAQEFEGKVTNKVAEITKAHTPQLIASPWNKTQKIFS
ncbi:MAG: caspase family protein [Hormoscilla sp. GM7CHS1pb]|nr:caspase family protein [Hormoscilla sp. GM7CHS1pb]